MGDYSWNHGSSAASRCCNRCLDTSTTGLLAMGYGIWLLLNAVAVLSPMKFFSSMQPIHAIQLMAIGGIAQHTKGLRQTED